MTDHGLGDTVLRNSDALVVVMRTASADAVKVGDQEVRAQYVWPHRPLGVDIWWKTQFA